jgi:hypothetical protein
MRTPKIGTKQEITNFAFSAFLFSTFGWILLETQLIRVGARPTAHLVVSALALALSAISFHRCRLWWPSFNHPRDDDPKSDTNRDILRDLCSCLGLLTAGAVLAFFVNAGSIVLLVLIAGGIGLVPWARIDFCRKHFFVSWGMLGCGGAVVLVLGPRTQFPFGYLLGAWVLWFVAVVELLVTYRGASRPVIESVLSQSNEQKAEVESSCG